MAKKTAQEKSKAKPEKTVTAKAKPKLIDQVGGSVKQLASKLPGIKSGSDQPAEGTKSPRSTKRLVAMIVSGIVVVAIVVVGAFGVLVYHYKSNSRITKAVASVVPYPVMKVNGGFVSYHEYLF